MASHAITQRTDTSSGGTWAAVVAAWSAVSWNGDSGSEAVAAIGAGNAANFIFIAGGPLNDSVIPLDAIVDSVAYSFDWQIFLTAGNELAISNGFGAPSDSVTVTGDDSGTISRTYFSGGGLTWQDVLDAHLNDFEWLLSRTASVQAGGFARVIISSFQILVTYHGGTPAVTFAKLSPVPSREPVLQGSVRG